MKIPLPQRHLDTETLLPWKCDDLTPSLCDDLVVSEGAVRIRGIDVRYWKYESSRPGYGGGVAIVAVHGGPGFRHNYTPAKTAGLSGSSGLLL
ncbi:hypothetical protein ACHAXA_002107 [Cyclostephanos tholiformis]|uniref:Prolyl aminopeptidase n=1 Tax=Cyclostephanos tholiformis TaxID=382380 RepID=A0ABD3R779_9STRA